MFKFRKAPIVELVLGIQFDSPVIDSEVTYDFYNDVKKQFPLIQEQPILQSIIETPYNPSETSILSGFQSRKWFLNVDNNKLIQIQSDRFLFNWRKTNDNTNYPHYQKVLSEFLDNFEIIKNRINVNKHINQLELTYVDHIILDDFGLSIYDLSKIFNFWSFPIPLKSINNNLLFPKEDINGVLQLKLQSAIRNADHKKLITCETTCRGMKKNEENIVDWFNRSHEIILHFFELMISENAKEKWGYYTI